MGEVRPFVIEFAANGGLWISTTVDEGRIVLAPITRESLAARFPKLAERLMATRGLEAPRVVAEKEDRSTFLW